VSHLHQWLREAIGDDLRFASRLAAISAKQPKRMDVLSGYTPKRYAKKTRVLTIQNEDLATLRTKFDKLLSRVVEVAEKNGTPRFTLVATFPALFGEEFPCFYQSNSPDEFFVQCDTMEPAEYRELSASAIYRIVHSTRGTWELERVPLIAEKAAEYTVLVPHQHQLVLLPYLSRGNIQICNMSGGSTISVAQPQDSGLTDVKLDGHNLLLCYQGLGAWLLDLGDARLTQVRRASAQFGNSFGDFLSQDLVALSGNETARLEIFSLKTCEMVRHIAAPESIDGIYSFPEHKLIAIGGANATSIFSLENWSLLRRDFVPSSDGFHGTAFNVQKCRAHGYYGIGNHGYCDIWSAISGEHLLRRPAFAPLRHCFAMSQNGRAVVCGNPRSKEVQIWQKEAS